jgi:phenylpropionate dioxygenase-like ring-hydroxylating dioxygenase large terminal subunit
MPEGDASQIKSSATARFGAGFLRDIWYFAALSGDLKPGKLQRYEVLGEPILLGRTRAGAVYALRDVCPHRAAPLSAGRLVADAQGEALVECPYHGWRFRTDGVCAAIPSLVDDLSSGWPRTAAPRRSRTRIRRPFPASSAARPSSSIGWCSTPISTMRLSG